MSEENEIWKQGIDNDGNIIKGYSGQVGDYKKDIDARTKQIKRAYANLKVNMEKLDNEFEEFGGKHKDK